MRVSYPEHLSYKKIKLDKRKPSSPIGVGKKNGTIAVRANNCNTSTSDKVNHSFSSFFTVMMGNVKLYNQFMLRFLSADKLYTQFMVVRAGPGQKPRNPLLQATPKKGLN